MNKKFLFLICLILFIFTISSVSAEDANQTVTQNTLSVAEGTFTELQDTINNAENHSTIYLNKNYVYDGCGNGEGIIIDKNIAIDGNGHMVDGNHATRLFLIDGANVSLRNIVFANGFVIGNGGAVWASDCNLSIDNSSFINNIADFGPAILFYDISKNNRISISNSIFNNDFISFDVESVPYSNYWEANVDFHPTGNLINHQISIDSKGNELDLNFINVTYSGECKSFEIKSKSDLENFENENIRFELYGVDGLIFKNTISTDVDGSVLFTFNDISPGHYTLMAFHDDFSRECNFTVGYNPNFTMSVDDIVYGENLTVYFNITDEITGQGNLSIWNNDDLEFEDSFDLNAGMLSISGMEKGYHRIILDFYGDDMFYPVSVSQSFRVSSQNKTYGTSFVDLQELIDEANDEIHLTDDFSFEDGDSHVIIDKDIRIYGNNHTIDARNSSRIFTVQNHKVYIENINFINANDCALRIYMASADVINCSFINNAGGAIRSDYYFGGVIDRCLFLNNTADEGAAIYLNDVARLTVSNSIFNNNVAAKKLESWRDDRIRLSSNDNLLDNQVHCDWVDGDGQSFSFVNVSYNGIENKSFSSSQDFEERFGLANRTILINVYENDILVLNITSITDDDGTAEIDYSPLEVGNYTLEAIYEDVYLIKDVFARMQVNFTMSVDDAYLGDEAAVYFNISGDVKGSGLITVWNPETYYSPISFGQEYDFPQPLWKSGFNFNDSFIKLPYFEVGSYLVFLFFDGDEFHFPKQINQTFNILPINRTGVETHFHCPFDYKYYGGAERLAVTLLDENNRPLANKPISIQINGVAYYRTTDSSGMASMAINLNPGEYQYLVCFDGDDVYSASRQLEYLYVRSTIDMLDYKSIYCRKQPYNYYQAVCLDATGNMLTSGEVEFNINGIFYKRAIKDDGSARLNINLNPGIYIITARNLRTGEMQSGEITVLPTIVENHDLVKYYRNDSQFSVELDGVYPYDGQTVKFNINGVFYERKTDENAIARLNINLAPGEYIITSIFEGYMASNKITVLPVLSASDLEMHYMDGSTFNATVFDGQGNPLANAGVTFNINGVFYDRTTDENGVARLNINLMSGEYIITSSYNGCNIANKITIV